MKLFRGILGTGLAAVLIGGAVWIWSEKYQQFKPDAGSATPDQRLAAWRSTAQAAMLTQATNDVPGFNRLIDSSVDTSGDLKSWTGSVTADYVNHAGGVDRTNLHYIFTSLQGDLFCQKN